MFVQVLNTNLRRKLRYIRYYSKFHGNKFYCNLCKKRSNYFLPIKIFAKVNFTKNIVPNGFRLNVRCPKCWAVDRERLVYFYLQAEMKSNLKNKVKLLYVAPRIPLANVLKKNKSINYISGDKYRNDVNIKLNIVNIPFRNSLFDIIICNHVLEHVEDDIQALKELFRILKPNGFAILQVPVALNLEKTFENVNIKTKKDRLKFYGQDSHVRLYSKKDYVNKLTQIGFKVKLFNFASKYGNKLNDMYGLVRKEDLFVCRKYKIQN